MPMPSDNIPDYLPDGSLNIHGKLARKFYINDYVDKNGKHHIETWMDGPTDQEILNRANEEMDKAYRNE